MFSIFSLFFVLHCLISCCDDDNSASNQNEQQSSSEASVDIHCSGFWTKDLMEFVEPVVTYTDFSGEHELKMPGDYCELYEPVYTIDGETHKGTPYYRWKQKITLKEIPVDNTVNVKFVRINNTVIDYEREYKFSENLGVDTIKAVKGNTIRRQTYTVINISIGGDNGLYKGQKAEDYLDVLCKATRKVRVLINDKLEITKE